MAKENKNGHDKKVEKPRGRGAGTTPNKTEKAEAANTVDQLDPELVARLAQARARIHETFGKVALAMALVPRYRNLSISDLQHLVLEPLMHDRIAIAQPQSEKATGLEQLAGIAIWASVTEEVDARIREQIKAGAFPVRLQPADWSAGTINWLLDVIAPDKKRATSVIANFKQVVKEGDLRIHPLVARLVDPEALKQMGAAPIDPSTDSGAAPTDKAPTDKG